MVDAPRPDVRAAAALAEGHRLGPFFAVSASPSPAARWRSLAALCLDEVLAERVEHTRANLARSAGVQQAHLQLRIAGSTLALSVFSRVLSPLLGAAMTRGVLPIVSPETVWWQPVSQGLLPVAMVPTGASWQGDVRTVDDQISLAAAIEKTVLVPLVDPVVTAFRRLGVSPVALRGNVVSSIGGAITMLDNGEGGGWSLLKAVVSQPYLLGTATVSDRGMRRRSCCLIYRLPGFGYCADCVLAGQRGD